MSRIKRIPIEFLRVGMYIAESGNDWIPAHNRSRCGEVKQQAVIDQIRASGVDLVAIDIDKGVDCDEGKLVAFLEAQKRERGTVGESCEIKKKLPLEQERKRANLLRRQALGLVQETMAKVKQGQSIDVAQVDALADDMVGSIYSNQNALICLSQIRSKDEYLHEHSCNVGLLMGVLAKGMGFARDQVQELIVGGMLHDIGKIRVPDTVLHKPGKLSDSEWAEMKRHVNYGIETLERSGVSEVVMSICAQHHERLNGGGYPFGLSGEEIDLYGRMAAVVDVYDAITAERCYHQGMAAAVAMKRLGEWSGEHLDRDIVIEFVRAMSIYPVGSLVELDSGELGVVIEVHPTKPTRPRLKLIYNTRVRAYIEVSEIDLASARESRHIARPVEPSQYGIQIADFI